MAKAIQLARKGLYTTDPNPRVGCVLVKDGQIVGEGWHARAGGPHAEIHALQEAGAEARGATAFVTLEPCSHHGKTPPCADALIEAGVTRVVAAMQDPNPRVAGEGLKRLAQSGIEVESGLLEAQARELNPGFIKRMTRGLPWVRIKLAMSLDGRTAMASGESQWITSHDARDDVHRWRARSSAILTGINTVMEDNPSLNMRLSAQQLDIEGEPRQPLRVIVDSHLRCPRDAHMLNLPGQIVVMTISELPGDCDTANVEVVRLPAQDRRVDMPAALQWLAEREINEVHVEAGSVLCGALLEADLVDELIIYMAPHIMGDGARGLFHLPEISQMNQRIGLEIQDIRAVGHDWRIRAIPKRRIIEEL
ncbi:MAG: bifunctional diaminohydroxyphosphoribosylaminopyrimidine deaminase/5-amino-6-(5-phosphoribosylamino)uracil reductase RibD [Gammaproteobacteria bacterium]|nr:MAG: bifunctional diaminohydroxyphosphoribosylaminopyrimidine deaminase/5-amino-6-(5-phosphoribosylamino)uracil reductase RibD [Gammaproteobacteria bacterium]